MDISFIASLAPLSSAINSHGQGGFRIQLEVPEDEYMEIYKLDRLKGMAFRVVIQTDEKLPTESVVSVEEA